MDLSDLLRMGKQYLSDAMPGGSLNPEVTRQSVLDGAAMAASPVPVLGDLLGLGADANRYATDPESRTPLNFGLSALGALPFVPAMTAWHGSPHKFDKFSLDKIGTGEGAQAYGHGLYLADNPTVATGYKETLTQRVKDRLTIDGKVVNPDSMLGRAAEDIHRIGLQATLQKIDDNIKFNEKYAPDMAELYRDIRGKIASLEPSRVAVKEGQLYKVDLPDSAIARMLDWDKPLSQQAPEVQKVLKAAGIDPTKHGGTGATLVSELKGQPGIADLPWMGRQESYLKQAGIPGIRYLDGGSRSAGQGSSNFVAFDPEMIRILERNGQPTGLEPWKPGEYRLGDLLAR